jgi:hypothetical protein
MATITVTIPENPNESPTTIKVTGVKGGGCQNLTASLEKALGMVTKAEKTEEFFEQPLDQGERQFQ